MLRISKINPLFKSLRRYRNDFMGYVITRPSPLNKYTAYLFKLIKSRRRTWWERTKRYIYRLDIIQPRKKIKYVKKWFMTRFLSLVNNPIFRRKQFVTVWRKAVKTEGSNESTFINMLSGNISGMLYNMQFYSNAFDVYRFIVCNEYISVNGKIVSYPKQVLAIGEIMFIDFEVQDLLRLNKLINIKLKRNRFARLRFMYLSHKFMFGLLTKNLKRRHLVSRYKNFDIRRAGDISK